MNICQMLLLVVFLFLYSCSTRSENNSGAYKNTSVSYYANKFEGKKTASGETYRHNKLTAANNSFSFGTQVEIVNVANSKKVIVTINDRGPLKSSRAFDLSQGAFKKIADLNQGVINVKYRVIK